MSISIVYLKRQQFELFVIKNTCVLREYYLRGTTKQRRSVKKGQNN